MEFGKWRKQERSRRLIGNFLKRILLGIKNVGDGGISLPPLPVTEPLSRARGRAILEVLNPRSGSTAVDVSGGVGNYSIFLSDFVEIMVHCELHVPSILAAYRSANDRKKKMLFIRSPYLKLPFNV